MDISSELRARAAREGISVGDLATSAGISYGSMLSTMKGRRDPRLSELLAFAKKLRVDPIELLSASRSGESKPYPSSKESL